MPRLQLAAHLLGLVLLSACVSSVPALPSRGAQAWTRWEGPHFVVLTNQDDEDGAETLRELERFYAIFGDFGWTSVGVQPVKVTAIVFENDIEMHAFVPHRWLGVFNDEGPLAPLIVTYNDARGHRAATIRHELVHYLISLSTPRVPAWFSEGVASYFQTAATNIDNAEVAVGRPDPALANVVRHEGILEIANLLEADRDVHGRTFYPSAWLLVHYLMTHHGDGLVAFHAALIEGQDPDSAWRAAFSTIDLSMLHVELEKYLERDEFTYVVREMNLDDVASTRHAMTDADVLAIRALLFTLNMGERNPPQRAHQLADRDLRALFALEPTHPLGTLVRLVHTPPPADEGAAITQRLAREHPTERRAWLSAIAWQQRANTPVTEILATALAALEHHPNDVELLCAATDAALNASDNARALELARRARKLRGGDATVMLLYALSLYRAGACDTADRSAKIAARRLGWSEAEMFVTQASLACRNNTPIALPSRNVVNAR